MFTSLFGKRERRPEDEAREPEDQARESETQESEQQKLQERASDDARPRSFFDRMRQAVTRTRQSLSDSISGVIALTREIDESSLDELEFALLASDIGAPTADEIITRLRDRALRHGLANGAELKAALKDEIRRILDSVNTPVRHAAAPPEVILLVGVNGTGKTTTSGKLAALYRREGRSVLLCAADTFRAAAIEQ